ncbi:permease [Desulfovibrio sp. OttesenSCG-928-G15]|nr:permease [Desulfovibrio sp. OttesenSCG-928-G15]
MAANPEPSCCCAASSASPVTQGEAETPDAPDSPGKAGGNWNVRYFAIVIALSALWCLVYSYIFDAAHWLVFGLFGFAADSHAGASLEFFLYDTVKILMLLVALIYAIAWIRASLNVERVRDFLAGKRRGFGYFLGALFGSVTPFCSCSSIPLFLGFTTARIPVGITMAFLITSPLINEIAVVLLWGLLGWKFTVMYVLVGMTAGIIGGFVMDWLKAERWLQPFIHEAMRDTPGHQVATENGEAQKLTVRQRHRFAYGETAMIFRRVWKWVIIGVGIGAGLHGFVPENWFAQNLGAGEWWSVPVSVFVAIPLYSNVTGIIPIMESLLVKGLPIGTTMAFCMSAVAASIPEVMMLRQIMTIRLQAAFIGYLWLMFTLVGWLFNILGPYIV